MDSQIYKEIIEHEATHWWFVSRRNLSKYSLDRLKFTGKPKILDLGCGSGGNLAMLSGYGEVYACEMNDQVREHSAGRNIGSVAYGKLPDEIPFSGVQFDLITMFDVLEHVEDDCAALNSVFARLNKNAIVFLTVPAFQYLFSRHDVLHHHFRRYSKKELQEKLEAAGFKVEFINYWNVFMFIPAVIVRILDHFGYPKNRVVGTDLPPQCINKLLIKIVSAERFLLTRVNFWFGLSLIVVARKN